VSNPEDVIGKDDYRLAWKEQAELYRADDRAVMESGVPKLDYEEPQTTPDGRSIWLRTSKVPLRNEVHEIIGVLGVYEDITERKRAEDQLRKLSLAVEQSSNIILITNTEGVIEYINPKFTEVTGYSAGEIIGRTPAVLSAHLTAKQKHERFWETLMAGREWHGEFLNRKKNGELFWCEEYIAPIHDASGKITHFVAVETDVTERRKTAEQLQQAQKMETVGRLAGGIAHDFNNLLMVIQGNLELLLEWLPGRSEMQDFVDRALHATGRSAELVSQLLLFSRRQFLQPQAVDVGALIGRMENLLGSMLMETISIRVSVPDGLWHAFADPAQLENALLNLALNARDAMPQGGALSIEAENVELASNGLPAGSDIVPGSFVRIRVADTGTGMPPEVLQRAFEPFFTTKEVGKGSGLGLSMVYGFVKQSGGHIEIDSAPDRGTRVDLYLRKTEPERVAEAPKGEVRVRGGGQTILIVEDNPEVREIAAGFLKKLGYRVIETASGPAALAIIESNQAVDLLFTGIVMPGAMSGVELARKALGLKPGIKLLFAMGYAEEVASGGSAHAMGGEILNKPYRKDDLARAVRDALKASARH
jgi:PAS domain S-box-containing protein